MNDIFKGQGWHGRSRSLLPALSGSILLCFLAGTGARGQIIPDTTLPNNSIVTPSPALGGVPESNAVTITGGTIRDSYLFHSFDRFSIPTGGTAFFDNPVAIENIISRVTGRSISEIDGLIGANGTANLFLLNPNGIIIGPNAALDIGGSFVGTTANRVRFADGSTFASGQEVPGAPPLLTINVPLGLQFGSRGVSRNAPTPPGPIVVRGFGSNLISSQSNAPTIRDFRPLGFEVNPGQTLALVGGDVTLEGGNLTAVGGRIELWSVANGELSVVREVSPAGGSRLKIESQSQSQAPQSQASQSQTVLELGDINLLQGASADASGSGGGEIRVRGSRVELRDGSAILADTLGTEPGGNLTIGASESVEIVGTSADSLFSSSLLADVGPEATGAGGNLIIESDRVLVADGAQVAASTFGLGDAGSLTVRASSVELRGTSADGFPSGLFAASAAIGAGGNLTVDAGSLRVVDGAVILADTFGSGDAGNLAVRASSVEIIGSSAAGFPSSLTASSRAIGAGGNLTIEAESLRVAGGAQVAASTRGSGDAGNLTVIAPEVELAGTSPEGLFSSGLFASAIVGSGNGGDTTILANKLIVRDGAIVSASNFPSLNPNIPPGTGAAGDINIEANSIDLDNRGTLSADTGGGDRGNIILQSPDIRLRRGSGIRTNAQGEATGGNITMDVDSLVALENSDITANAQQSFGGRVIVNAQGIFGTEFRLALTPESDITASSELGAEFSGIVELNTPDTDPSSGLLELPGTPIDIEGLLARDICAPEHLAGSSFVIAGRGGLPANPLDPLTDETIALDWSRPSAASGRGSNSAGDIAIRERSGSGGFAVKGELTSQRPGDRREANLPLQIREAQGWIVAPDGTVILTAEAIGVTPASPILVRSECAQNVGRTVKR